MSKYDVAWTGQFKKDYKLARKRNLKIELLDEIIRKLSRGEVLSQETGQDIVNVMFNQTVF